MKRTFVCASSCIKQYVQPSYGCRGTPVVARMCVYTARKNYLIHKNYLQKSAGTRTKNFLKIRVAAAKKNRYKRSRDK